MTREPQYQQIVRLLSKQEVGKNRIVECGWDNASQSFLLRVSAIGFTEDLLEVLEVLQCNVDKMVADVKAEASGRS